MPELAEVDYFRRRWDGGLGHPIERVAVHPAARVFRGCDVEKLVQGLEGQRLHGSLIHGKQMLFRVMGGFGLGIHLGMTGEMRMEHAGYQPKKHDHLVLFQQRRVLVFADSRMFGRVRFDEAPDGLPSWWQELPPGLLDEAFTVEWVAAALARRARSPLKAVLLDQQIFPGVGNWMADELLWRLRWHPLLPAGSLTAGQQIALWKEVRWLAENALATIGVEWNDPPEDWLYRYRWATGHVCPRCHTGLAREDAAGRTTCWCPVCQPEPELLAGRLSGKARRTGHRRETPFHGKPETQ